MNYTFENVLYTKEHARDFMDDNWDLSFSNINKPDFDDIIDKVENLNKEKEITHVVCPINKIGNPSKDYVCSYRIIPFYEVIVVGDSSIKFELQEYLRDNEYNVEVYPDYISGDLEVGIDN